MVYSSLQWFTVVYSGLQWFTVVYPRMILDAQNSTGGFGLDGWVESLEIVKYRAPDGANNTQPYKNLRVTE